MFVRCLNTCVSRTKPRAINRLEVDTESADWQQRQLLPQELRINTGGHHGAEYHVAACTGKTVEVNSLHLPINGRTSPALPINTSSHKSESGVRSGFTSQTYAPAAFAISGSPAAG